MKNASYCPSEEYRLIDSLKRRCNFTPSSRYPFGAGDDAVLRNCSAGERIVLTADTFVEDVHFSARFMDLREIGYKVMAANISDCAAMGAVAESALVQVVFPRNDRRAEGKIKQIYEGFHTACVRFGFAITGGNLSSGPCWVLDVTMVGRMEQGARPLRRCGAKPRDVLWVSGRPGESGAGLAALGRWGRGRVPAGLRRLVRRHVTPEPRVSLGRLLARRRDVHAAIDISDGVSKECRTLSYENNMIIELDVRRMHASKSMLAASRLLSVPWTDWFLSGGEDYELLFATSPRFGSSAPPVSAAGCMLRPIGRFAAKGCGVYLLGPGGKREEVPCDAWDHLHRSSRGRGPLSRRSGP